MEHTWLGRSIRRLGRIGIGVVAFIAGFAAFAVALTVNRWLVGDDWVDHERCGWVGVITAMTFFALCDRFGLVPEDADPPTTLSLSGPTSVPPTPDPSTRTESLHE